MRQDARGPKRRNPAVFEVWHGGCNHSGIPGRAGVQGKRKLKMSLFKANNAFAAIAAFAISAICMAAAIVPASPSGLIA